MIDRRMPGPASEIRVGASGENRAVRPEDSGSNLSRRSIATASVGETAALVGGVQVVDGATGTYPFLFRRDVSLRVRSVFHIVSEDRAVRHERPALLSVEIALALGPH